MNIGEAARATGVSAKMIRHYEACGLLPKAERTLAGYRRFGERDLRTLDFIRNARDAGFSLARTKSLLALWRDPKRPAREVRALAGTHLSEVEAQLRALQSVATTLAHLVAHCQGDNRPDCPILVALAARPQGSGPEATNPGRTPRAPGKRG